MGLKADIIATLESRQATITDFTLFGHRISGQDYRRIAGYIRTQQIQIVRRSDRADTHASYDRTYNCFTVGNRPSNSLVVHEATHAINDLHSRSLDPVVDEALAYLAQMIYACRVNPSHRAAGASPRLPHFAQACEQEPGHADHPCTTAVVGYATRIAVTLMDGERPDAETLRNYRNALSNDPNTRNRSRRRHYDGIRHVHLTAETLQGINGEVVTD